MSLFRNLLIAKANELPAIYRKVDYLYPSEKNVFVNTGFVMPEEGATIETEFVLTVNETTSSCIYGSRSQNSPYSGILFYRYGNNSCSTYITATAANAQVSSKVLELGTVHRCKSVFFKMDGTYYLTEYINDSTGTTVSSTTSYVQSGNQPIYLFASNNGGVASFFTSTAIKSFKILSSNGIKVMDLIPCVRKTDNTPGFFDLVGRQFLTNAGSGRLIATEYFNYEDVLYKAVSLYSDGQSYINTGFIMPEEGASLEIDFTCRKWLASNVVYGSRSQNSPYPGYLMYLYGNLRLTSMLAGTVMREVYGDTNPAPTLSLGGSYNVLTSYYKDGNNFGFSESINGEPIVSKTGIATTYVQPGECPLFIFASNNGGTPTNVSSSVGISRFKINNYMGRRIAELISCVRVADNAVGMLDKVSGNFLTNAGSGEFTYE